MKNLHYFSGFKLGAALLAAAALVGCGGSDNDDPAPTASPTPTPDPVVEFPVQDAAPTATTLNEVGTILTAADGLSLYFFDNDAQNDSNCNGDAGDEAGQTSNFQSCAGRWPPLLAGANAVESGAYTFVTRDDGTTQWAFNGYPLYTFFDDDAAGDVLGDGLGDVWHLARPIPAQTSEINGIPTLVGRDAVRSATSNDGVFEVFRSASGYDGLTLYTFDVDGIDEANCYTVNSGGCINAWPPLLADEGARAYGKYSLIDVEGQDFQQWAYNGKALYFFFNDAAAGDTNGQGVGDVWWIATKEAAIFRTVEGQENAVLSAVGRVETLLPASEGDTENFVKTTVDKDQFTLYTFDNDGELDSNCSGGCQVNWPPLLAAESDADIGYLTKFTRDDGEMQWAFNGKPLYFYFDDNEGKETNGDGLGGVWHLVNPLQTTTFAVEQTDLGETITVSGEVDVLVEGEVTRLDKTNFQLYVFDNDTAEDSNCSGGCAAAWPPLLASADDVAEAPFSIFTRDDDGLRQWAINGYPLYFYTPDDEASDAGGEAANDVWWVARPAPVRVFNHETEGAMLVAHGFNVLPAGTKSSEELQDLTLYTFDEDVEDDVSTCFDTDTSSCATIWPPLEANALSEAYGSYVVIDRGDGTFQWSYKGDPLYFVRNDDVPGDTNGLYGLWPLARPQGNNTTATEGDSGGNQDDGSDGGTPGY